MRFEGVCNDVALRVTRRPPAILLGAGEFVLLRFGVRCGACASSTTATGEAKNSHMSGLSQLSEHFQPLRTLTREALAYD
jgi:hypothetical protein